MPLFGGQMVGEGINKKKNLIGITTCWCQFQNTIEAKIHTKPMDFGLY